MSTPSDLERIADDITGFNTVAKSGYLKMRSGDERIRMTAGSSLGAARTILTERLFKIVSNNPNLHLKLLVGRNGIEAHEILVSRSSNREVSAVTSEDGLKAWAEFDIDQLSGAGDLLVIGNQDLAIKLGTLARVVAEGGRLVVVDESPIADEPSESE